MKKLLLMGTALLSIASYATPEENGIKVRSNPKETVENPKNIKEIIENSNNLPSVDKNNPKARIEEVTESSNLTPPSSANINASTVNNENESIQQDSETEQVSKLESDLLENLMVAGEEVFNNEMSLEKFDELKENLEDCYQKYVKISDTPLPLSTIIIYMLSGRGIRVIFNQIYEALLMDEIYGTLLSSDLKNDAFVAQPLNTIRKFFSLIHFLLTHDFIEYGSIEQDEIIENVKSLSKFASIRDQIINWCSKHDISYPNFDLSLYEASTFFLKPKITINKLPCELPTTFAWEDITIEPLYSEKYGFNASAIAILIPHFLTNRFYPTQDISMDPCLIKKMISFTQNTLQDPNISNSIKHTFDSVTLTSKSQKIQKLPFNKLTDETIDKLRSLERYVWSDWTSPEQFNKLINDLEPYYQQYTKTSKTLLDLSRRNTFLSMLSHGGIRVKFGKIYHGLRFYNFKTISQELRNELDKEIEKSLNAVIKFFQLVHFLLTHDFLKYGSIERDEIIGNVKSLSKFASIRDQIINWCSDHDIPYPNFDLSLYEASTFFLKPKITINKVPCELPTTFSWEDITIETLYSKKLGFNSSAIAILIPHFLNDTFNKIQDFSMAPQLIKKMIDYTINTLQDPDILKVIKDTFVKDSSIYKYIDALLYPRDGEESIIDMMLRITTEDVGIVENDQKIFKELKNISQSLLKAYDTKEIIQSILTEVSSNEILDFSNCTTLLEGIEKERNLMHIQTILSNEKSRTDQQIMNIGKTINDMKNILNEYKEKFKKEQDDEKKTTYGKLITCYQKTITEYETDLKKAKIQSTNLKNIFNVLLNPQTTQRSVQKPRLNVINFDTINIEANQKTQTDNRAKDTLKRKLEDPKDDKVNKKARVTAHTSESTRKRKLEDPEDDQTNKKAKINDSL